MAGVVKNSKPEHRISKLDRKKVVEAVSALLAYHKKIGKEKKKELLLNEANVIQLQLAVWKIGGHKSRTIKIQLPHTISGSTTDACLFVKDIKGKSAEDSADHYTQLLEEKGVKRIAEVIPLKTYRAEYKAFLARRQLVNKYDVFLADERIFRLMHSHLGKEFYKKKKYPVCVCMTKQDLKGEIEGAIDASYLITSHRGDCNHFKVAHTDMTQEQIIENVMAGVQNMVEHINQGWPNIKALYLKTNRSISLPIYTSLSYKNWDTDMMTTVDNRDIAELKKKLASDESAADEEMESSSTKMTAVAKKVAKTPKAKQAKKRVLTEKPLANKKGPASPTDEKKRRLSGRALKKLKLKKEMEKKGVTDSRTLSAELKKLAVKASKAEGISNVPAKAVSKSKKLTAKGKKGKPIKQPTKVEKPKAGKKRPGSAKKQKLSATSS